MFAVVLACTGTLPVRVRTNDPAAARALIAYLAAGERASFVVAYEFSRTRADGSQFPAQGYEARTASVYVTRLGDTLSAVGLGKSLECSRYNNTASCKERAETGSLPLSETALVAIEAAPYDVWRLADARIAGERAQCFALRSRSGARIPQLGLASEFCFDAQGVPLRRRVYTDVIDDWEATSVTHRFDLPALAPLLVGFEAAAPGLGK